MEPESLTAHLYRRQDVIVSLVQSLLTRRPAHECLFWLWELVYTMDTIVDSIRCIVLLFYSSASPGLLRFIAGCLSKAGDSEDLEQRARVISPAIINLRSAVPWVGGYLITSFQGNKAVRPDRIYGSPNSAQTQTLSCLKGAIRASHYRNIGYYLGQTPDTNEIEQELLIIDLPADQWKNSDNDRIYVAALVARSLAPPPKRVAAPAARCFAHPTPADLASLTKTFSIIDSASLPAWKKLPETRLYSVHSTASPEWEASDFDENAVRNCWLFGCSAGIAWRRRLAQYQASFKSQQICFAAAEAAERFDALYALELDEQTAQVQFASFRAIERIADPVRWIESLCLSTKAW